jgi:hypothetical protein
MTGVSWSRWRDAACIRLAGSGLLPEGSVEVRAESGAHADVLPPMAGRVVRDGADLCFVPRFPFLAGTTYAVVVGGIRTAVLVRPRPDRPATAEVLEIYPTASEVPRNLLRLYVWFSVPMSEGSARTHVRLVDDAGAEMEGALFETEHELWDPERRRLTVLLDPARIKRGLAPHREIGYPLQAGVGFRVVVDAGFRDGHGTGLRAPASRRYAVGEDERRRVEPGCWRLQAPPRGSVEPFEVGFDRPLDHALVARCVRVQGPDGHPVEGKSETGSGERSWRLLPFRAWPSADHRLIVDPVLEDVAGNSISRVFDRDLGSTGDDDHQARAAAPGPLVFRPG